MYVDRRQIFRRTMTSGLLVLFASCVSHRVVEFAKSLLYVSLAFNAKPPAWGIHQREM